MLAFLIHAKLDNKDISEMTIAIDFYGKSSDFDSEKHSLVRNEMYRIRKLLDEYYAGEGFGREIKIIFPNRTFVPLIYVCHNDTEIEFLNTKSAISSNLPTIFIAPEQASEQNDLNQILYELASEEICLYANVTVSGFINRRYFENYLNKNVFLYQNFNYFFYLLTIKCFGHGKNTIVFFSLEDIRDKTFLWKDHYVFKQDGHTALKNRISMIIAKLLDEKGILYSYIGKITSSIIKKPKLLADYYRFKSLCADKFNFVVLFDNVKQYLKIYPDDSDILAIQCYLNIYMHYNLFDVTDYTMEEIFQPLSIALLIDPESEEVQNVLYLQDYLRRIHLEFPDFSSYLRIDDPVSPIKSCSMLLMDYFRGGLRGYENKILKRFSSLNNEFTKGGLVSVIHAIESFSSNPKRILIETQKISHVKFLSGPLFRAYAYHVNGKRVEAVSAVSDFDHLDIGGIFRHLNGVYANKSFVDTVLKGIDEIYSYC